MSSAFPFRRCAVLVIGALFFQVYDLSGQSGNVGIGTASPEAQLHIALNDGAGNAPRGTLLLTRKWNSATDMRGAGLYNYWNGTTLNDQLVLAVSGDGGATTSPLDYSNARVVIQANGNVGIGTSTPAVRLEVNGQMKISGGGPGAGKVLLSDASGLASWSTVDAAGAWSLTGNAGVGSGSYLGTADAADLSIRTAATQRIRVKSDGKVAIGSGTPAYLLHVQSNLPTNATPPLVVEDMAGAGEPQVWVKAGVYTGRISINGSNQGMYIGSLTNNTVYLQANSANIMTLTSGGNVGIGTTGPAELLDVYGNIAIRGKQAIADNSDGYLRLNQGNQFPNGVYTPGMLRSDGGIVSGAALSSGAGTVRATVSLNAPVFYDSDNVGYYINPAGVSNINTLRFNSIDCLNGYCPTNGALRSTPNLHLNTTTGYALIVNWDNGAVGASTQQFRVGNGQGSDVFYVKATGNIWTSGGIDAAGTIYTSGNVGIGNNSPAKPLSFPASLGEKILLYPGVNGEVGIGVYGNELRLHCDNPGSSVSFGTQDNGGTFTQAGRFQISGGYALFVNGSIWANGTTYASDARFKSDVRPIESPLDQLMRLRGVNYALLPGSFPGRNFPEGRQIGLLAQEVETVVPEAVQEIDGYKGVDYARLVPLLIEAIKEQERHIRELESKITRLEQVAGRSGN